MSKPSYSIVPAVGSSRPARHLTSVVLPDPERPTIATVVPGSTVKSMSSRIGAPAAPP